MSLFRYPVRPLSDLGKVLLCVAMSLLAALLLLVSPPTRADDSDAHASMLARGAIIVAATRGGAVR